VPTLTEDDKDKKGFSPDVGADADVDAEFQKIIDRNYGKFSSDNSTQEQSSESETLSPEQLAEAEGDSTPDEPEVSSAEGQEQVALNDQVGGKYDLFNPTFSPKGRLSLKSRAGLLAVTGIVGITFGVGGFLGFLNTFRLKHLIENVNLQAFTRYNAAVDRRSDVWIRAYFKTRLLEWGDGENARSDDGNLYFRGKPNSKYKQWYQKMRTGDFEEKLLKNHGIRFYSMVDNNGNIRPARIDFSGNSRDIIDTTDIQNLGDLTVVGDLDGNALDNVVNRIDGKLVDIFENDADARRAIKKAVNNETKFFQVVKRRKLRKTIASATGVRDWRFFDKTRTKVEDAKKDFQRAMIQRVLPEDSKSQQFLLCMLGLGGCSSNTDPNNPENRRAIIGDPANRLDQGQEQALDENGNPIVDEETGAGVNTTVDNQGVDELGEAIREVGEEVAEEGLDGAEEKFNRELIQKLTSQLAQSFSGGPVTTVKKVLDWLLKFDNNLARDGPNGRSKLGNSIYMARITTVLLSATALYVLWDQIQDGSATPEQVNEAMNYFNDAATSEAFSFIFEGQGFEGGTVTVDGETVDNCETGTPFEPGKLVPLCDQQKPNGGSKIDGFEAAWAKFTTGPIGELIDGYRSAKNNPVTGFFISLGDWIGDQIGSIVEPILNKIGLTDLIGNVAGWVGERVMTWVGVKPCMTGLELNGGVGVNCATSGMIALAENAARTSGGVLNTVVGSEDYNYSRKLAHEYVTEQRESMSAYEKYADLNNPQSFASNFAFTLTSQGSISKNIASITSFGSAVKGIFGGIGSIFTGKAKAQGEVLETADFAGVDEYNIVEECINAPLPEDDNYNQYATNASWIDKDEATLFNEDSFAEALYEPVAGQESPNADTMRAIADTYNCAALDNTVMGGLGYTSGYTDDDGYSTGGSQTNTGSIQLGSFIAGEDPPLIDTDTLPCPLSPTIGEIGVVSARRGDQTLQIKLCRVHDYSINAIMAENFDDMYTAFKAAGYTFEGNGGNFRSSETQAAMYARSPNSSAPPGRSNHELGLAVDTSCSNGDGSAAYTPWMPGKSRGMAEFQRAIQEHPCLNGLYQNSFNYGLLLQCAGKSSNGGEILANSGGCETWHLSPTGK